MKVLATHLKKQYIKIQKMKYKSIGMEVVLFSPTSPSEAPPQPPMRRWPPPGVAQPPSARLCPRPGPQTLASARRATVSRRRPAGAGGEGLSGLPQWLRAALPLPARPPPARPLAGTHSCALSAAQPVTRGPGSPGMPGWSWGPQTPVFLFRNSFAASAPTSPFSFLVPSTRGRRERSLGTNTLCVW